jgi:hypothetical protein
MPIHGADYHQRLFSLANALGAPLIAADAMLVPLGFEDVSLLIKNFSQPVISGGDEIQITYPGGGKGWAQSPIDTSYQSPFQIKETEGFRAQGFFSDVLAAGGYFDARIYEGTTERFLRTYMLRKCFIKLEPTERDAENRNMIVIYNGTLFGHYFGETEPGNIA